jgi:hypothetical protein
VEAYTRETFSHFQGGKEKDGEEAKKLSSYL